MNLPPLNYGVIKELDSDFPMLWAAHNTTHYYIDTFENDDEYPLIEYLTEQTLYDFGQNAIEAQYIFFKEKVTITRYFEDEDMVPLFETNTVLRYRLKSQLEQTQGLPNLIQPNSNRGGGAQRSKLKQYFETIPPKIMTLQQKTAQLVNPPIAYAHLFVDHTN